MAGRTSLWVLLLGCVLWAGRTAGAADPLPGHEPSLEPEFQRLRETLRGLPEFRGADAQSSFRLAEELAHRGDVHGAVAAYRDAIALNPKWAEPYRGLGQVFLDHHDYAPAADALQTAIRLGTGDPQTFHWLARAFMGKQDLPAAAAALERATGLKADDADAFADLGLVRMAQGKLSDAEQALSRAIMLKPDYADAHRLRDVLMKHRRDPEQAKQAALALLAALFTRP
ncbi:tetratricopeptide repeat protein [Nitrospira moscoviensis]|uniref:Uncharacterized protein n=1 Tax=Nitrospira moscoviensis TaxID=42253 RepID=A0A0K2GBT3_NITMO|nr:tetratricopeptide repeat protein [Nitrospira moscoviensis]ALA58411.1 exported protein of unknown function [Nitrospira moscoviensis]